MRSVVVSMLMLVMMMLVMVVCITDATGERRIRRQAGQQCYQTDADCLQCSFDRDNLGYLADCQSNQHFYQCQWLGYNQVMSFRRECAPCTEWDQDKTVCVRTSESCQTTGTTSSAAPVYTGEQCKYQGQSKKAVYQNVLVYQVVVGQIIQEMPCAPGTVFQFTPTCSCVHGGPCNPNPCANNGVCTAYYEGTTLTHRCYTQTVALQAECANTGSSTVPDKFPLISQTSLYFMANNWFYSQMYRKQEGVTDENGVKTGAFYFSGAYSMLCYRYQGTVFSEMSISLWFKRTDTSATSSHLLSVDTACDKDGFIRITSQGPDYLTAGMMTSAQQNQLSAFTNVQAVRGLWHHVVLTYNESTLTLYVDKQMAGSVAITGTAKPTCPVYLGKGGFKGYMDMICFFKKALSAEEVASVYDAVAVAP